MFDFVLCQFLHPQGIVGRRDAAQMRAAEHSVEVIDVEGAACVAQDVGKTGMRAAQKHGGAVFCLHQERNIIGKRIGNDFTGIGAY